MSFVVLLFSSSFILDQEKNDTKRKWSFLFCSLLSYPFALDDVKYSMCFSDEEAIFWQLRTYVFVHSFILLSLHILSAFDSSSYERQASKDVDRLAELPWKLSINCILFTCRTGETQLTNDADKLRALS